jgi:hypothetical protein
MNPVVQKMPKFSVLEEDATAMKCSATTEPKPSKSIAKPKKNTSRAYGEPAAENMFSVGGDTTNEAIAGTEPLVTPGPDERRSYRSLVPHSSRSCEVKVGANVLPASLFDESEGGFAVLIDRLDGLETGKKVKLHTEMGWFTVRIIYINNVARPKDAPPEHDTWFRVGIKKVRGPSLF